MKTYSFKSHSVFYVTYRRHDRSIQILFICFYYLFLATDRIWIQTSLLSKHYKFPPSLFQRCSTRSFRRLKCPFPSITFWIPLLFFLKHFLLVRLHVLQYLFHCALYWVGNDPLDLIFISFLLSSIHFFAWLYSTTMLCSIIQHHTLFRKNSFPQAVWVGKNLKAGL